MIKFILNLLILLMALPSMGEVVKEQNLQIRNEQKIKDTKSPENDHKRQRPPTKIIYKGVSKTPIYLCERGDMLGCFRAGEIYYNGSGVKRSVRTAITYFRMSCRGGYGAGCTSLADLYLLESGLNSRKKAINLYQEGCKRGDGAACFILATHYQKGDLVKKDNEKSVKFLKRACELNYEKACER